MRLLAADGHDCYAPDWPGYGFSDKVSSNLDVGEGFVPGQILVESESLSVHAEYS
jgi:pimeloyl-ACP methyl ester carboxylesterase